jgi:uncharacterized BrkB/YihY/UPF0761 family membrane protein
MRKIIRAVLIRRTWGRGRGNRLGMITDMRDDWLGRLVRGVAMVAVSAFVAMGSAQIGLMLLLDILHVNPNTNLVSWAVVVLTVGLFGLFWFLRLRRVRELRPVPVLS